MTAGGTRPEYYEQHYEALRREAFGRLGAAQGRGHGLALFLTRGMVAWMKALAVLDSPCGEGLQKTDPAAARSGGWSAGSMRGELTRILAGMILACHEETTR